MADKSDANSRAERQGERRIERYDMAHTLYRLMRADVRFEASLFGFDQDVMLEDIFRMMMRDAFNVGTNPHEVIGIVQEEFNDWMKANGRGSAP